MKLNEALEPGIYVGLNEERYHADPALGSTDHHTLLKSPPDYWWESWMNPAKKEKPDTKDQIRGTAAHVYVLQGRQLFDATYSRRPDDDPGDKAPDKAATTKAHNAQCAANGLIGLHGDDYDRIRIASQMIIANPKISDAFTGGLSEVSVFWIKDGVRLKMRGDYMKPRATTDLKSLKNILKIDFKEYCLRMIAQRNMHIQAEHYNEGRRQMASFHANGAIHGKDFDKTLLQKIAASDDFAFGWVFYQADGAPSTWGRKISPKNPILIDARDRIDEARRNYQRYMKAFGETMWIDNSDGFDELYIEDIVKVSPWFGTR